LYSRASEDTALASDLRSWSGVQLRAAAASLAIFAVSFVFRFNALGGALGGFGNDHFIHLARARLMVAGEVPFRDFSDVGAPLTTAASALVQWLFGYHLLGEALLTVGALSFGAAATVWLAARITGRVWPAIVVGLLQVAISPRLYNYSKILCIALGIWLCWRYVDRPSWFRLVAVALSIAIGFLFRHDYAFYLGMLAAATVGLTHRTQMAVASRRVVWLTGITLLLIAPYLLCVQLWGGTISYFKQAIQFTRADSARTSFRFPRFDFSDSYPPAYVEAVAAPAPRINVRWAPTVRPEERRDLESRYGLRDGTARDGTTWNYEIADTSAANIEAVVRDSRVLDTHGLDRTTYTLRVTESNRGFGSTLRRVRVSPVLSRRENAVAWLYYTLVSLPIVAAVLWVVRAHGAGDESTRLQRTIPYIWPVVLMMGLLAIGFLSRGTTNVRLADVSVPAAILAAWLISPACKPVAGSFRMGRVVGVLLVLVSTWYVCVLGAAVPTADRSGLLNGISSVRNRTRIVSRTLRTTPPLNGLLADANSPFAAVARYVATCTPPNARLLIVGNMPELYFYSGRLMAGGHSWFVPGYGTTPAQQQQTLARIRAHDVPLVVTDAALYDTNYAPDFPLVDQFLRLNYRKAGTMPLGEGARVDLLLSRQARWVGRDPETGLPCYSAPADR
jgi:hypothetical protein